MRNRSKVWREKHHERVKAQRDKWNAENKHKKKAHRLLRAAVIKGEVIKDERCSECCADSPLVAHHHDYNKPLDVHWLCKKCHAKEHGVAVAVGVPKTILKGEAHGCAKLRAQEVTEIRSQLGVIPIRQLAKHYGVSESLVRQIKNGKNMEKCLACDSYREMAERLAGALGEALRRLDGAGGTGFTGAASDAHLAQALADFERMKGRRSE